MSSLTAILPRWISRIPSFAWPGRSAAVAPPASAGAEAVQMSHGAGGLAGPPRTAGYRPSIAAFSTGFDFPALDGFTLGVVDEMLRDSQVNLCLLYRVSPLFTAEFAVEAKDPSVQAFVAKTLERYWRKSMTIIKTSYAYGYSPAEVLYKEEGGLLQFDRLKPLHPRDCRIFTLRGAPAFVRVKAGGGNADYYRDGMRGTDAGAVDLETARKDKPAKGLWLIHDANYTPFYGRPVLRAVWYPWRLKTMTDGGMEILFKWMYRHAFTGKVIRHPNQVYQDDPGSAAVHAQDEARTMANQMKTGANLTMSSERDANGNYLWEVESYGEIQGDAAGLISYIEFLDKQIQRGTGIPDEIITHDGNTGGYSRSQVAAASFFQAAEFDLNQNVEAFDDQICRPLTRLNFGAEKARYTIKPQPLLPPEKDDDEGGGGQEGGDGANPLAALLGGQGGAAKQRLPPQQQQQPPGGPPLQFSARCSSPNVQAVYKRWVGRIGEAKTAAAYRAAVALAPQRMSQPAAEEKPITMSQALELLRASQQPPTPQPPAVVNIHNQQPAVNVSVPETPAPVVHVETPAVHVAGPTIHVETPKTVLAVEAAAGRIKTHTVERDENDRIVRVVEKETPDLSALTFKTEGGQ